MEPFTKVGIEVFSGEIMLYLRKFNSIRGLPLIGGVYFCERFIFVTPDLQGKSTPEGSKPVSGN
jgi:hypothetical protein